MGSYDKTRWYPLLALLMLVIGGQAFATEGGVRLSQSVEGVVSTGAEKGEMELDQADVDELQELVVSGSRIEATAQRSSAAHPAGDHLSIFDAHSVISRDDDDDGYYHRLKVVFDADTSGEEVWVYARLYLSLEGGPWNHYFTTDVFPVSGYVSDDEYEVVTRLLDGYPSGYYDVLIELYDADYDLLEVNYGPYEDGDLAVLPLEDYYRDDYGGGGATGMFMLMLGLLAVARRYAKMFYERCFSTRV
ncbi:choice-of-anchor H family protein [Candidatus Thiodiazotropha sp. CDECU1]|uniref:choice-of-anchor H family protein n=1 Tax=Candidatus Thiodiazotropha sp. CDECU1 TaxID=3065865 RepID=UPI00292FD88C|nr:choice-of-anchor H family protein [Candidatus Thiodiazotropha sp. CDECU1]